ncbi:hypothetical protein E4582_13020 [Luteimonas yindakuii]|uniref:Uncharacterized protein n=1 Tax=Luteimonas yindakuii TaxID=2565782 RepID=A0A4Z1R8W9_9GAMM|nr:hypothetical protein [Luteimonas yindakuii]QCO66787.1 hypothetical protein E5843_01440 [Luteimonas yindakuii]TKS53108.1 hypothetical protein E4582_13020 [Luteimonas yindakuii]
MNSAPVSRRQRNRNRALLVAVVVIFLGSALMAGALRFSGWRPEGMRNHGELLQPPGDLRAVALATADGAPYAWQPAERTWRIALAPPAGCNEECVRLSADLDKVWQLFGRQADRVHILWMGEPPANATHSRALHVLAEDAGFRAGLARNDDPAGVPVYVIDPNGFVILRYAPGFDAGHLRTDMARLLKLK